jgi:VanZ family protein
MKTGALRWLPALAYMGLITYLSSQTGKELPQVWWMKFDKVLHAMEYAGLGFLVSFALGDVKRRVLWATLFGFAFGAIDEFHQGFVPGRQGNDPGDLAADLIGSFLGALSYSVLVPLVFRRRNT